MIDIPNNTPRYELGENYKQLQRIYLDWHEGIRPLSGFIREIKKWHDQEIARAVVEIAKAYGGCTKCYGKGYATTLDYASGGGKTTQNPLIRYCTCERGKQLETLKRTEAGGAKDE